MVAQALKEQFSRDGYAREANQETHPRMNFDKKKDSKIMGLNIALAILFNEC